MSSKKMLNLLILALLLIGVMPAAVAADPPQPGNVDREPLEASGLVTHELQSGVAASPAMPVSPDDVLWDQVSDGYNSIIAQYFPDFSAGVFSADDFQAADTWNIETIFIDGDMSSTALGTLLDADSLNWLIYPDAGGVPAGWPGDGSGTEIWTHSCLPTDPEVTITGPENAQATLDVLVAQGAAVTLPPGTYWLVFYPSLNYTSYGQWFWDTAGTTNLTEAQVIDPAGLVGLPNVWTPWPTALGDPALYDAAFRLEGTTGAACTWVELLHEDFEDWPPAGWTIVDNLGGGEVWESTATTGATNYAGGDGECADADSDYDYSYPMDTELWTPPLDLTYAVEANLQYVAAYNDFSANDYAEVLFSDDGGMGWTQLSYWDTDHDAYGPGESVTEDLTSYVGNPNSHVSFHYATTSWDYRYEVDQVIVNACLTYVEPKLELNPPTLEAAGCPDVLQTHSFNLYNQTGVDDTFDLTYNVSSGNGTLTGPDQIYLGNGADQDFVVELTPDACLQPGEQIYASIEAAAQATTFTAESLITKTITAGFQEWIPAADTPQGTRYHAVAEYGGAIYQFGGEIDWWTPVATVNKYDIATDTWGPAAPLPVAMNSMDAVTIGDLIYLPGGIDDTTDWRLGGTFLDTLYIYDPVADSWSTGAAMPAPLGGASAVTDGSLLYVIGGLTNAGAAADTLYIYDPGTDSWTSGASMAGARGLASAAYANGQIFVAGGYLGAYGGDTTIDTTEVYDISTDTWSAGPALPHIWAPYGDAMYAGRYFVIFNGGDLSTVEGFYCSDEAIWWDTDTGALDPLPLLPRCLYGSQGVAVDNRIYSFSGRTNEGGWHMAVENQFLEDCPACTEIGWLEGYVEDAELGGGNPACTDAIVHLDPGDITIPVDPMTGYYWAEVFSRTYTVDATADGYSLETEVVDVTTGMTTTQDFGLWRAVIAVEPSDFVSVPVLIDVPTTFEMTIDNLGHLPLDFEIFEIPGGVVTLDRAGPEMRTTWLEGDVEIDSQVLAELDAAGTTDFFVRMRLQADLSGASAIEDWEARGQYVYDSLVAVTPAQGAVISYAQAHGLDYETRLVINAVFIKGGTLDDVNALAAMGDVKQISANKIHELEDARAEGVDAWGWNMDELDPNADLYGMEASQVWKDYGVFGDGIVVANIDTGAYYQHEALDRNYRGNLSGAIGGPYNHDYNWYDPSAICPDPLEPCDNNGHGSGTMGIMAGETQDLVEQIGAAPGAQWIACKGCETNSCSEAALTGCADWMVAPCPAGVAPGDPSCDPAMRPHVINNSWGDVGCDLWYQPYIQAWVAGGQFPAFSAGNTVACSAVGSPGDTPEAFGTAAHNFDGVNLYAGGPSCYFPDPSCDPDAHEVDPHLNAPTFGRTSDNYAGGYFLLSGTSGASPHTAGCVALIWSANPSWIGDIGDTFTLLEQTADRTSTQAWNEGTCGKPTCAGADPYPNFEYGWGYLDCLAAVEAVYQPDIPWLLTDPVTGTVPPEDAVVVDLTVECTQTMDYTGTLSILNSDPCNNPFDVPLGFHCVECIEVEMVDLTLETADPIYVGDTVDFLADIMPDSAVMPYNYSVDFGDGTAPVTGTSSDDPLALDHTYTVSDTYTVEISVWNCDMAEGDAVTDLVDVTVMAVPFHYIYLPIVTRVP